MTHALSFPNYLPEKRDLRAYFLVYDRVSTIVPGIDQNKVKNRAEAKEIISALPSDSLGFFDPTWQYTEWFDQPGTQKKFQNIARKTSETKKSKELVSKIKLDQYGYAIPHDDCENPENVLVEAGWNYLAYQKFPFDALEKLFDLRLAARVPSIECEELPVLIHPRLGDFVLSRLARHIASSERIPPVAPNEIGIEDCLFDGEITAREQRAELLSLTLDISIPENISQISVNEFKDIRDNFADVRKHITSLLDGLLINLDLDSDRNARAFREHLRDKASDISARIGAAQRRAKWRGKSTLGVNIFVSAFGSAVGAAIGDIPGALVGGAIAPVLSSYANRFSTRINPHDHESIEQFAAIKTRVEQG